MRTIGFALFVVAAACAHERKSRATHYLVKGKAYDGCNKGDQFAVGRVVRLVDSDGNVLTEATVAVDGTYVLQPSAERVVDKRLFVDADGSRAGLFDTAAEWVQNGVYTGGWVTFPCTRGLAPQALEKKPAPGLPPAEPEPEPEREPRPPPRKELLVPTIR